MKQLILAAALVAVAVPAAAQTVPTGKYECWAWGQARLLMNFTVTGPGVYRKTNGAGTFKVGPGGKLAVTGPMMEEMPDGFSAVYHAPGGKPTVSFRGRSGSEAAFCERAGK